MGQIVTGYFSERKSNRGETSLSQASSFTTSNNSFPEIAIPFTCSYKSVPSAAPAARR